MLYPLFCTQCSKEYKVTLQNVNLAKKYKSENISFDNDIYTYKNGCFFKDINSFKSKKPEI